MQILLDEELRRSPLRTAFTYASETMRGNWKNSILIALALLVLSLFGMLPPMAPIASVLQGIFLYALAVWAVDTLRQSENLSSFRSLVHEADVSAPLRYLAPAAGLYTGFMLFSLLMVVLTALILWASGGFTVISATLEQASSAAKPSEEAMLLYAQILGASAPALVFVLLSSLFFGYLWPLVYGYALSQKSFLDAFNAVFAFFSPRFWRASMTGRYFRLVSLWMLVMLGIGLLLGVSLATVVLLPLGILLLMWTVYFSAIVSVATYNLCDEI